MALPGHDRSVKRPARAARQRDQSVGFAFEPGEPQMRRLARGRFEKGAGIEPHEAAVAAFARGQENNPWALEVRRTSRARGGILIGKIDGKRTADDRLDPRRCHLVREFERDRKSTRLNSSHLGISYAVFCLKKKKYS